MKPGLPTGDHNPDRIRCTVCDYTRRHEQRIPMLPGPVCESCYEAHAPASAPYWRDWERSATPGQRTTLRSGNDRRYDAALDRQLEEESQRMARRRVVGQ